MRKLRTGRKASEHQKRRNRNLERKAANAEYWLDCRMNGDKRHALPQEDGQA